MIEDISFVICPYSIYRGQAFLNGKIRINLYVLESFQDLIDVIKHEELHNIIEELTNFSISSFKHHYIVPRMIRDF